MRKLVISLLLLLVVGCGKSKPPTGNVKLTTGAAPPLSTALVTGLPGGLDQPQSRSPAQWGELLTEGNPKSRQLAASALADLGKAGFPELLRGMQSNSWEVRLTCLRAVPKDEVVANVSKTLPLMQSLASDNNPQIAQYAIVRLGWFGPEGRSAMPLLENKLTAYANDAEMREDIVQSIVAIHDTPPLLAILVRHSNPILRKAAAVRLLGLSKNGTRIDAAANALADRVSNDTDAEVRSIAAAALQSLSRGK
jgi:HEAT repeat protein